LVASVIGTHNFGPVATSGSRRTLTADLAAAGQSIDAQDSPNPLTGFRVIEVLLDERSPATGKASGKAPWPAGHTPVSVLRRRLLHEADPRLVLSAGDRVSLLVRDAERAVGNEPAAVDASAEP
jgi:hypothetical protein